jgi:tetratricopeptide (TPR) repeat protein
MSNVAKLKKKAAEFEQKKQFDKALAVYVQILEGPGADEPDAIDVALYNRVGDLLLRQGDVADALTYYEKAVDLYAESGFFNNAIALCNKILRQSPGRASIYYKLGKISARKGFKSDAKQNFLEYADRMQKAGQLDEAFRALKEFADLCPDQDDIRLMLAEQLSKRDRKEEALEQLQMLYEKLAAEGRQAEARATLDRMKAIDPDVVPRASGSYPVQKPSDLVFLDVSWDDARPAAPGKAAPSKAEPTRGAAPPAAPSRPVRSSPISDLPLILPDQGDPAADPRGAANGGAPVPSLDGLAVGGGLDAAFARAAFDAGPIAGLELTSLSPAASPDPAPLSGSEFAALPLDESADLPAVAPQHDLALRGELPPLDLITVDSLGAPLDDDALGGPPADFGIQQGSALADAGPDDGAASLVAGDAPEGGGELAFLDLGAISDDPLAAGAGQLDVGSAFDALDALEAPLSFELSVGPLEPIAFDDAPPPAPERRGNPPPPPSLAPIVPDEAAAPDSLGEPLELISSIEMSDADLQDATDAHADASPFEPHAERLAESPPAAPAARAEAEDPAIAAGDAAFLRMMSPSVPERGVADAGERFDLAEASAAASPRAPATTIEGLRLELHRDQNNGALRQRYAEALFEAGDREAGLHELELAMIGFERADDLEGARSVADEIIRINPSSVRHHQKRVEYAFRTNDKPRLCDAYLQLADALFRTGQAEKSRAVYKRVLELNPGDARAQAALGAFVDEAPAPPAPSPAAPPLGGAPRAAPASRPVAGPALAAAGDQFVNLGDWLRDDAAPRSTRMVVAEEEPTGDEEADFADMLRKFKQGIAENLEEDDHESHYDLGVAFKEMGLVDEAIAEFQKALRAPGRRVRAYEALGQCFVEKSQFQVAATILQRALAEPGAGDDQLVGVLYLLGYTFEALHRREEALASYQRVFAVDIQFRDVSDRLAALEKVTR